MRRVPVSFYPGAGVVEYHVPIRPDADATLILPIDLTLAEVIRLTKFLCVLVEDEDERIKVQDELLDVFVLMEEPKRADQS